MVLNMGPQHPSTHGVLRLEVVTDGEIVVDVIPHIGYLHRCFEKHAESLTYPQVIPYVDRMDYLAAMNNELAWAIAVERLLGIEEEIHPRVQYIRVLMAELNRISSHLVSIGTFGQDAGAVTPFLWCFRDREHILNLFEWASGARLLYNYIWIGGLMHDLPLGFEERCREFVEYFRPKVRELNELLTYNKIFIERTANVGVLPVEVAVNWGCSGPMLRGSGLRWDLRRDDPYAVYPELDFEVCVGRGEIGTVGDSWNRYKVRAEEIEQSLRIVEQCLDQLQRGIGRRTADFDPQKLCPPRVAPPKDAEVYARFENPRGELGFYILSDGTDKPFRVKARAPSFSNLSVLPEISRGAMLADLIVILGSIDIVLGEVDR
ncbi:MAG: NADH-quinone oxidoreductase subunit D [Bacteroidetes bacterium]|nr:NADH-quinone oxidoreductase subunit D [Rhodothermia bacterium]MCS7155519.1 NADH-quinone oxidoreductase subunit D [Bacteroidota bacterium]MCX7907388.1 NADH-quinone oxidoreductase subunit D [Bacteroidota bacterium]MDW8138382.1 NADH-quinone oxidoreductase subunit D [Bacteroidota bacterium]MDW8284681.1 NADH-quinone oxidoreductase subunit D [Bacteroidota bacterium]